MTNTNPIDPNVKLLIPKIEILQALVGQQREWKRTNFHHFWDQICLFPFRIIFWKWGKILFDIFLKTGIFYFLLLGGGGGERGGRHDTCLQVSSAYTNGCIVISYFPYIYHRWYLFLVTSELQGFSALTPLIQCPWITHFQDVIPVQIY